MDRAGTVYAADLRAGRVFVLSPGGRVLKIWGKAGSNPGQFSFFGTAGVAAGPYGNIFVADTGNSRIQVFSPYGKLLRVFRRRRRPIHPFSPTGIAVDANGDIYTADAENDRLLKLSPSGRTLATRCLGSSVCRQD